MQEEIQREVSLIEEDIQREGPVVAKALLWDIGVLTRGTKRTGQSKEEEEEEEEEEATQERSGRCEIIFKGSECDP